GTPAAAGGRYDVSIVSAAGLILSVYQLVTVIGGEELSVAVTENGTATGEVGSAEPVNVGVPLRVAWFDPVCCVRLSPLTWSFNSFAARSEEAIVYPAVPPPTVNSC